MNMNLQWQWLRKVLENMDEKQLSELFHDLNDLEAVERIADCAYHFVENNQPDDADKSKGAEIDVIVFDEEKDWSHADDALRYMDIKSTQDSFK